MRRRKAHFGRGASFGRAPVEPAVAALRDFRLVRAQVQHDVSDGGDMADRAATAPAPTTRARAHVATG